MVGVDPPERPLYSGATRMTLDQQYGAWPALLGLEGRA
jgi:hypothetical protein